VPVPVAARPMESRSCACCTVSSEKKKKELLHYFCLYAPFTIRRYVAMQLAMALLRLGARRD
jgi:hypothetical protein